MLALTACDEKKSESGSTFTDSRDGKAYKTVKIGSQTWMAENLNYKPSSGESWCYDNKESNCGKWGRLYDWNTAKMVCPSGWHLPNRKEWGDLSIAAGGTGEYGSEGTAASKKLKAKSGWNNNGNGTDDFGFLALPGGDHTDEGGSAGYNGFWWTATEDNSGKAYGRQISFEYEEVREFNYQDKAYGYSVRCVQGEAVAAKAPAAAQKVVTLAPYRMDEFARRCKESDKCEAYPFVADPNGNFYHFVERVSDGNSKWDGMYYKEGFTASSTLAQQGNTRYDAANTGNGDRSVTWCEGVKGHGIGERVNMRITTQGLYSEDGIGFTELMIVNGYAKNQTAWKNNSRVKAMKLYVGGKHWYNLNLKDVIKPQVFKLETTIEPDKFGKKVAIPAEWEQPDWIKSSTAYQTDLSFEIAEIYAGDKFDDTCITGIALEGYSKVY